MPQCTEQTHLLLLCPGTPPVNTDTLSHGVQHISCYCVPVHHLSTQIHSVMVYNTSLATVSRYTTCQHRYTQSWCTIHLLLLCPGTPPVNTDTLSHGVQHISCYCVQVHHLSTQIHSVMVYNTSLATVSRYTTCQHRYTQSWCTTHLLLLCPGTPPVNTDTLSHGVQHISCYCVPVHHLSTQIHSFMVYYSIQHISCKCVLVHQSRHKLTQPSLANVSGYTSQDTI